MWSFSAVSPAEKLNLCMAVQGSQEVRGRPHCEVLSKPLLLLMSLRSHPARTIYTTKPGVHVGGDSKVTGMLDTQFIGGQHWNIPPEAGKVRLPGSVWAQHPTTALRGSSSRSPARLCAKPIQLCPILCDPGDRSPPGSSVHGILQARILKWVATPSSRGSS